MAEKSPPSELKFKKNDLSCFKCVSSEPLKETTIGNLLREAVTNFGDRIAINSQHQNSIELTFNEAFDQVNCFE